MIFFTRARSSHSPRRPSRPPRARGGRRASSWGDSSGALEVDLPLDAEHHAVLDEDALLGVAEIARARRRDGRVVVHPGHVGGDLVAVVPEEVVHDEPVLGDRFLDRDGRAFATRQRQVLVVEPDDPGPRADAPVGRRNGSGPSPRRRSRSRSRRRVPRVMIHFAPDVLGQQRTSPPIARGTRRSTPVAVEGPLEPSAHAEPLWRRVVVVLVVSRRDRGSRRAGSAPRRRGCPPRRTPSRCR